MADIYCSIFPETVMVDQNPWVVVLSMEGQRIMLLNGGDMFRPNPSISLMYLTSREEVVESLYMQLIEGGKELMPLTAIPSARDMAGLKTVSVYPGNSTAERIKISYNGWFPP